MRAESQSEQLQLHDPVCGMVVRSDSEHQHNYADTQYYFCSDGCRKKFSDSPQQYLNQDATPVAEEADETATDAFAGDSRLSSPAPRPSRPSKSTVKSHLAKKFCGRPYELGKRSIGSTLT